MHKTNVRMAKKLIVLFVSVIYLTQPTKSQRISVEGGLTEPHAGTNVTINCRGRGDTLQWSHGYHEIIPEDDRWHVETQKKEEGIQSQLTIIRVGLHDSGKYHCRLNNTSKDKVTERDVTIHVQVGPILKEARNASVRVGNKAKLSCTFAAVPAPDVHWVKDKKLLDKLKGYSVETREESDLHLSDLIIDNATLKDNGSYECVASNVIGNGDLSGKPYLLVQDVPEVNFTKVRPVGTKAVEMEWSVQDGNSPILQTKIFTASGEGDFKEWSEISGESTKVVLEDVGEPEEHLRVKIKVINDIGEAESQAIPLVLLTKEPKFIPKASPRGSTLDSFTVGWTEPSEGVEEFVGYYMLSLTDPATGDSQQAIKEAPSSDHMFTDLKPATQYEFKVAACMDVFEDPEKDCGEYSLPVNGRTLNGVPNRISDLLVDCKQNTLTAANTVIIRWKPPNTTNGIIDHYKIEIIETASFINEEGQRRYYNNEYKENVPGSARNYTYFKGLPNTNYTVKVYAGSRRQYSSPLSAVCRMPVWVPVPERVSWWKYLHEGQTVLKLPVPRVSQRNGTICCHRIVVVKLAGDSTLQALPSPSKLPISTYEEVHRSPSSTGAYVAEAFSRLSIKDKYLLLGDGKVVGNWSGGCATCHGEIYSVGEAATSHSSDLRFARAITRGSRHLLSLQSTAPVEDGILSQEANYTGFVVLSGMF